jgi:hypothetical protein
MVAADIPASRGYVVFILEPEQVLVDENQGHWNGSLIR